MEGNLGVQNHCACVWFLSSKHLLLVACHLTGSHMASVTLKYTDPVFLCVGSFKLKEKFSLNRTDSCFFVFMPHTKVRNMPPTDARRVSFPECCAV